MILCAHGDVVTCNSNTDTQLRTSLDVFLLYKGFISSVTRLNICTPFDVLKNSENNSFNNFPGVCLSIGGRGAEGRSIQIALGEDLPLDFQLLKTCSVPKNRLYCISK